MILTKRFFALLTIFFALSTVSAQNPGGGKGGIAPSPFKPMQYKGDDGKMYNYPKWSKGAGKVRFLLVERGTLAYPQNPPVTKVIFNVYKAGAVPGSWQGAPAIRYTIDPNPKYDDSIGGWTFVGQLLKKVALPPKPGRFPSFTSLVEREMNKSNVSFNEGDSIKLVWEVTTTNKGVDSDSFLEVVTVVNYH